MTLAGYDLQDNVYIYSNNKCMCVFLISPVPITEPLTSELIDTPVFYNLAPRPIKYRVSVPIPSHHTHIYTYKHILKLCLESYTVTLLLLYLQHSVCKLCGVCKCSLCMESQGDILHLPKYIRYRLTHCLEYCIPECYVQLTIDFSFPKNSK